MRILTFGTLYPDATRPHHGVFVEHRLRHLLRQGGIEARVVAPVPWFPLRHAMFGDYGALAQVPAHEVRHGIDVLHPRFLTIPKVGMNLQPRLLARAARPVLARIIAEGFDFDLLDAQYFYPDGVAAVMIGQALGKPVSITARGTDLNLIPAYRRPREMIQWAARHAACLVTVCLALKQSLIELGVPGERVTVLRNGVDLELFHPVDRAIERARLHLTRPTLISVGHLIPRKGHDLVIAALPRLPGVDLLIAGTGEEDGRLRALVAKLGLGERVRFVGRLPQDELCRHYGAADALVLASDREGWANVLLEAMACGTPVVATNIWGTPEVVTCRDAGLLTRDRSAEAIADAVRDLFAAPPDRAATRRYAEGFSWDETARGLKDLFSRTIARTASR